MLLARLAIAGALGTVLSRMGYDLSDIEFQIILVLFILLDWIGITERRELLDIIVKHDQDKKDQDNK